MNLKPSGASGATRLVRAAITPPKASDPYATDPGPRATSTLSSAKGSRNVALGPTRRSAVTRAPSIRISVRPAAKPRMAGTAACPSDTLDTPATFSSACVRLIGARVSMSSSVTSVVPLAGRGLDARGGAGLDRHGLADDRLDGDVERSAFGELVDEDRLHVATAGQTRPRPRRVAAGRGSR